MAIPAEVTLTPAEAAELLGLSGPFVAKLLERSEIPSELLPSSRHRRIRLEDVLAFQARRERRAEGRRRIADIAATASLPYLCLQNVARVFVNTNVLFPFSVMDLMLALTEDGSRRGVDRHPAEVDGPDHVDNVHMAPAVAGQPHPAPRCRGGAAPDHDVPTVHHHREPNREPSDPTSRTVPRPPHALDQLRGRFAWRLISLEQSPARQMPHRAACESRRACQVTRLLPWRKVRGRG